MYLNPVFEDSFAIYNPFADHAGKAALLVLWSYSLLCVTLFLMYSLCKCNVVGFNVG